MSPEELRAALTSITSQFIGYDVVKKLYGIDRTDKNLWGLFRGWGNLHRKDREIQNSTSIDRYAFEAFMQKSGLTTHRLAAVELGMTESSLRKLLDLLQEKGIESPIISVSKSLLPQQYINSFYEQFEEMQHRVFSSHCDYCERLHKAIESKYSIAVEAVLCANAKAIVEHDYTSTYDCLTG